jgi:hypothetical protein
MEGVAVSAGIITPAYRNTVVAVSQERKFVRPLPPRTNIPFGFQWVELPVAPAVSSAGSEKFPAGAFEPA